MVVDGEMLAQALEILLKGPHKAKSTSMGEPAVVYCAISIVMLPLVCTFRYIHMGLGVEYKQLYWPMEATPVELQ